jgi:hypothetical protein
LVNDTKTVITVVFNKSLKEIKLDNETFVPSEKDTEIVISKEDEKCPIPKILQTRYFTGMFPGSHSKLSGFQIEVENSIGNLDIGYYKLYLKSKSKDQYITIPIPIICVNLNKTDEVDELAEAVGSVELVEAVKLIEPTGPVEVVE